MEGNNISGKFAFFRDTFLNAEKDYLKELKKDPRNIKLIEKLNRLDPKTLCTQALKRIEDIETGKIKEEDLEKVEAEITLILAAIEDYVRERIRERHIDVDDGRGR